MRLALLKHQHSPGTSDANLGQLLGATFPGMADPDAPKRMVGLVSVAIDPEQRCVFGPRDRIGNQDCTVLCLAIRRASDCWERRGVYFADTVGLSATRNKGLELYVRPGVLPVTGLRSMRWLGLRQSLRSTPASCSPALLHVFCSTTQWCVLFCDDTE
eukprot:3357621-Rhodomonas_salina.1